LIDGFPYFVNGLGGSDAIYDIVNMLDGSLVRYNGTWGAMLVDATTERITFQFITSKGEIIDTFTIAGEG
jgi:hypothetical protein